LNCRRLPPSTRDLAVPVGRKTAPRYPREWISARFPRFRNKSLIPRRPVRNKTSPRASSRRLPIRARFLGQVRDQDECQLLAIPGHWNNGRAIAAPPRSNPPRWAIQAQLAPGPRATGDPNDTKVEGPLLLKSGPTSVSPGLEEDSGWGSFPRCAEIDPWMSGADGANCPLITVESPIELSHFVAVGVERGGRSLGPMRLLECSCHRCRGSCRRGVVC
jgi:hypothetical protein